MPQTHPEINSTFGMVMSERAWTSTGGGYRFGFNGMEKDDEVSGVGNSYTAEYWQYDSRLGRRWNMYPVNKSWLSSFAVLTNRPIIRIDPLGNDDYTVDRKGRIKLLNETDDESDRLIRTNRRQKLKYNDQGELENKSVSVKKGVLTKIEKLEGTYKVTNIKGEKVTRKLNGYKLDFGEDAENANKVFEFLADNTMVEFSLVSYEKKNGESNASIYTSRNRGMEGFGATAALYLAQIHAISPDEEFSKKLKMLVLKHNHPRYPDEFGDRGKASDKDWRTKIGISFFYQGGEFWIREKGVNYRY